MRVLEQEVAAITPGEEWIFRAEDDGPSRRVRIVGEHRTPTTIQMEIEHLEGPRAGQRVTVGLRRLKGPWSGVAEFDDHDRRHRDLESSHRNGHSPEYSAATAVAAAIVPNHVMEKLSWPGRGIVVHDPDALATVCDAPFADLVHAGESLESESGLLVNAQAFIRIAKAACTAHPDMMTAELLRRERRLLLAPHAREVCSGAPEDGVAAVLHDWCGTQPSEIRLRVVALENELSWQRALVRQAMEMLTACGFETLSDNLASLSRQGPRERRNGEYPHEYAVERSYVSSDAYENVDAFPW
jgi:hypothetical protein